MNFRFGRGNVVENGRLMKAEEPRKNERVQPAEAPRLQYRKPELRRLGSVRELTLGGTQGMTEGAGTFRMMM